MKNRIANLDEQTDDEIVLGYIGGLAATQPYFTVTLNQDDKFQLFFEEDAYVEEMEQHGHTDRVLLEEEIRYYLETVELPISLAGGV